MFVHGRLPLEIGGVSGSEDRWIAAGIAQRRIGDEAQRDDARPYGQGVVVGVVFDVTRADFGGDFGERKLEDAGSFQLSFVWLARIVPAARNEFFGEGMESGEFFGGIVEQSGMAEGDDGAVVHGVIENGACKNEAVGERDGDADGETGSEPAEHATGSGAVEIEMVSDAREHGREDKRLTGRVGEADVAEQGFVKDFVNGRAIVDGAIRLAHHSRTIGDGECIGHADLK